MAGIATWSAAKAAALPCGSRAKYVGAKCRCPLCRAANAAYYHTRQRALHAAALEHDPPPPPAPPQQRTHIRPADGRALQRTYRRSCPGLEAAGCPFGRYLRRDSVGGICSGCRQRLGFDGLVPAGPAHAHLRALRAAGVGRIAVSEATDINRGTIRAIAAGLKPRIRASIERRILAVDVDARAGGSLVPAGPTWRRLERLIAEGFTRAELARRLGFQSPAIQFRRDRVLARTAVAVERLYWSIMVEAGGHVDRP